MDEEEYGETSPLITEFSLTKSYQKSKNLQGQDELVEAIVRLNNLTIIWQVKRLTIMCSRHCDDFKPKNSSNDGRRNYTAILR